MFRRPLVAFVAGVLCSIAVPAIAAKNVKPKVALPVFVTREDVQFMMSDYDTENVLELRTTYASLEQRLSALEQSVDALDARVQILEETNDGGNPNPIDISLCTSDLDCSNGTVCQLDQNSCQTTACATDGNCMQVCYGQCVAPPPPAATCGNLICEGGEADVVDAGGCGDNADPECLGPPATWRPGSCPSDCL